MTTLSVLLSSMEMVTGSPCLECDGVVGQCLMSVGSKKTEGIKERDARVTSSRMAFCCKIEAEKQGCTWYGEVEPGVFQVEKKHYICRNDLVERKSDD